MTILWDVLAGGAGGAGRGNIGIPFRTLLRTGHGGRSSASPPQQHQFTYDRELIAERSVTDILSMAGRAALAAPRLAFETFNSVTGLVWDVTGQGRGYETVSNSGDLPQALYGRETLNRLKAALVVIGRAAGMGRRCAGIDRKHRCSCF